MDERIDVELDDVDVEGKGMNEWLILGLMMLMVQMIVSIRK